jgi:anthranilate synthase component II
MLLLIDNYDSFTYNLVHYFGELGHRSVVKRNNALTVAAALALKPKAIVLSPGPCTPNEAGICLNLIGAAAKAKIPLLGVCLGHQALGQKFGGRVIRAPHLMHGKLSTISTLKGTETRGLFKGLPKRFDVTRYHSLIVERSSLPKDLIVTAETDDGLIMGLEHRTQPIFGVQFHPESIASEHGHAVLANFLDAAGLPAKRPNRPPDRPVARLAPVG